MEATYFEFEFIKKLNTENKTNNLLISPIGIEIILSLCLNGAEGATQREMIELLKHQTKEETNDNANKIISELDKNEIVKIANGILTKIQPSELFIRKGKEVYKANIDKLKNYNNINKWVMNKTNNKIKKIIDNLSPDVMMVLLNAIYFEAFWKIQFDINHTYEKEFKNIDDSKEYVDLMFLRGEKLPYYENEFLMAVKLDYNIPDNSINAIVILPKDETYLEQGINYVIESLDDNLFYTIVENLNKESNITKVNFYLPKYELEYNTNINEILKELGMKKAFEKEAEFKGICFSHELNLFINQVIQKNYINVNEKGTQACSASELEIMLESYLTKDETAKDFIANRPFLFILRNEKCPKGHDIIFFNKICNLTKENK